MTRFEVRNDRVLARWIRIGCGSAGNSERAIQGWVDVIGEDDEVAEPLGDFPIISQSAAEMRVQRGGDKSDDPGLALG